jgi:hypothetical protein
LLIEAERLQYDLRAIEAVSHDIRSLGASLVVVSQ